MLRTVSFSDLDVYSQAVSQAFGMVQNPSSILGIQQRDTPEKWGIADNYHDDCYGRHILYRSQTCGDILFWIGVTSYKNGINIAATFNRKLLAGLNKIPAIQNLRNGTHTNIPNFCNIPGKSTLIEIRLSPADLAQVQSASNPPLANILADFLNEVLGVL